MLKTFALTLDLEKPDTLKTDISVSQADVNTSQLTVNITQDGAVLDLTGLTAKFVSRSPNGSTAQLDMTIEDALNGVLSYSLVTDNMVEAGVTTAEVILYDANSNSAVTQQFTYTVRTSILNSTTTEAFNAVPDYHTATFNRLAGVDNA